jgi:aspartyl/asparaginyl-tRNA synthetase
MNATDYNHVAVKLRKFFQEEKGFLEVHTQSRLSILAACEDPRTIATFSYAGNTWPLPQTGQMWLEHELLKNPDCKGMFCMSTSFRNEPNPIPGRHDLIFPMFEFETHGGLEALKDLEAELLEFLGFGDRGRFPGGIYWEVAGEYGVEELKPEHEARLYQDYGSVFFLEKFPIFTSPFWNMAKTKDYAHKVDVILCGIETIGSAERSCDVSSMREAFHTISGGMYADILYAQFGKERVENELDDFLNLPMIPRSGGGIGVTRMIKALHNIHRL